MEPDRADRLIRVNLAAPIRLTRAVLPGMLRHRRGHVVNVASIAGHVGVPDEAVYSATKAGLITFSDSLRYELDGTNVGVSVVSPGVVDTAFFDRRGRPYDRRFPRPIPAEPVAAAITKAIRNERPMVFVPSWGSFPARLRGGLPGVYRALARRFG
jgi:short-subunit dehydrogenase